MRPSPIIGITSDLVERTPGRWSIASALAYSERVQQAGGTPIVLSPIAACIDAHITACDAIVLIGGNDPDMRQWGIENHPEATLLHPQRQQYETALLDRLRKSHADKPVLGICLGMQLMCLDAGGRLHQHLPDLLKTADQHRNADHEVRPVASPGSACPAWLAMGGSGASNHHQGVADPGRAMRVLATSDDGVIEAVRDDSRRFYLGVQWHPERTADERLGLQVFKSLVQAAVASR